MLTHLYKCYINKKIKQIAARESLLRHSLLFSRCKIYHRYADECRKSLRGQSQDDAFIILSAHSEGKLRCLENYKRKRLSASLRTSVVYVLILFLLFLSEATRRSCIKHDYCSSKRLLRLIFK